MRGDVINSMFFMIFLNVKLGGRERERERKTYMIEWAGCGLQRGHARYFFKFNPLSIHFASAKGKKRCFFVLVLNNYLAVLKAKSLRL